MLHSRWIQLKEYKIHIYHPDYSMGWIITVYDKEEEWYIGDMVMGYTPGWRNILRMVRYCLNLLKEHMNKKPSDREM